MNRKLLLADDSITIQKVIGITFANEDVALSIADNGDSAFEMAQADHPDLVMADILMPGRNGYELCEAIKRDPQLGNVPVLLLSGTFEPFDEEKAKAAGADGWIAKPFESQALIEKVQKLLSLSPDQLARPKQAGEVAPQAPVTPVEPAPVFTAPEPEPVSSAATQPDMWREQPPHEEPVFEMPAFEETQEPETYATASPPPLEEQAADAEASIWDEFSLEEQEVAGDDLPVQPLAPEMEPVSAQDDEDILVLDEADIIEEVEPPAQVEPYAADLAAESAPAFAPETDSSYLDEVITVPVEETEHVRSAFEEPDLSPAEVQAFAPDEPRFAGEPSAQPAAAAAAPSLSEEQMTAVLERVAAEVVNRLAGTILERIAWEVVPDLAESLIKDEIRKIKDALK